MEGFNLWSPLFSIVFICAVYSFGERITAWTKGLLSSMTVAAIVFIIGFVSGILPKDVPLNTGMGAIVSAFGTFLIVTHLGTVIKFKELLNEWKTVAICLAGILGIIIICLTVGSAWFGREMALTSIAPIAGGIVAATLTAESAIAAGRDDLAAFAFLVMSFQGLIGMPLASFFLKRECDARIARGEHLISSSSGEGSATAKKKLFKPLDPEANTWIVKLAKLAFVSWLGVTFSTFIKSVAGSDLLPAAVAVLFFGILFHEIGFLDDDILNKAGGFNILMLALYHLGPTSYSSLDFEGVKTLAGPLFGLLIAGAIGIIVLSLIVSKPLKVSANLAIACGLAAMFGFPGTLILTTDAVKGTGLPEDQRKNLMDQMLPKMIVAGFTTVTIVSVLLAGVMAPYIFN